MANVALDSRYGKIHRLKKNPRVITDSEFTGLVASLDDDEEFLEVRGIVVWQVPADIKETHPESLFAVQSGKMVILGGNQRYLALMAQGKTRIDDDWIVLARHKKSGVDKISGEAYKAGDWWSVRKAERFVLKDNNPEGLSGEFDYGVMMDAFDEEQMRLSGIDFGELPMEFQKEGEKDIESEVEEEEHGENQEGLEKFIKEREKSRSILPDLVDVGFYMVPVFESSEQRQEFAAYLQSRYGIVSRGQYLDGVALAKAMGYELKRSGLKFPDPKPEKRLQAMAYDGSEEGWESGVEELEEGTESEAEGEEKYADGADMSFEDNGDGAL